MPQLFLSSETFFAWHDWARIIALAMPGLLFVIIAIQFIASRSGGRAARFLNNGSLRTGLIVAFALITTIPIASLGVLLAERSAHQRHDRMADRLERNAIAIARDVNHILDMYVAGVSTAASSIGDGGDFDAESLQRSLLLHHETYANFLTMLTTDSDGKVQVATSNMSGYLTSVEDLRLFDVSDRSYFREPMADGKPSISKVFRGRGLGSDPIVAISAAIRDVDGTPVGVVEGSLNLSVFGQLQENRPYHADTTFIMLDQDDRVIFASAEESLSELESLSSHPLVTAGSLKGDRDSYDFVVRSDSIEQRYVGALARTQNGWTVYGRMPLSVITRQMQADYMVSGLFILGSCLLSLLAATAIDRRLSNTVDDMNHAIAGFNADGSGEKIRTPRNTPSEFRPIFKQMRKRAKNLKRAHERLQKSIVAGENLRSQLTQAIARKDAEIFDRTTELEEANQRLKGLSRSDALTGIPNRREFDTFEERIWRSSARNSRPLSVILLDIDYFKIYNDTLGHQEGDNCLIKVARELHKCATRPLDLVARYGGEEFVTLLGDAEIADALAVAERMRRAVCDLQIAHPGSAHGVVTVSAGAASIVPDSKADPESLLKAADDALYYAKAAGRNCIVYPQAGEYVTFDTDHRDTSATNVMAILSGKAHRRH